MLKFISNIFAGKSNQRTESKLDILFRPIGTINDGKLRSFGFGQYDSLEYKGRENDTLVFIHTTFIGGDDDLVTSLLKWSEWPMSTFDLSGVKNIKIINEVSTSTT
jgi:hypothetical protein